MKRWIDNRLMCLVWQERLWETDELRSVSGESIKVLDPGEWDEDTGIFTNAEVRIDNATLRGDVLVGREAEHPGTPTGVPVHRRYADRAVLQLIDAPGDPFCRSNGSLVPQMVADIPTRILEAYGSLRSDNDRCKRIIRDLDPFLRVTLMTRLLAERFQRKFAELMEIHRKADENWSETLYVMLFRTMGDHKNKEAFTRLAQAVPYNAVMNERNRLFSLEAMFFGASGLLNMCFEDEYVLGLKREFNHLHRKYDIKPLPSTLWDVRNSHAYNLPTLRIAQLAAFLHSQDFVFDRVISCRTTEDVVRLFSAEASEYWTTHYKAGGRPSPKPTPKRIGETKAYILGINLVAHMIFAYGTFLNDDELREEATNLLERIPPESNVRVDPWTKMGVPVENAFDSQAVIELKTEYCDKSRCAECGVGKSVIKEKFRAAAQSV